MRRWMVVVLAIVASLVALPGCKKQEDPEAAAAAGGGGGSQQSQGSQDAAPQKAPE